MSEQVTFRDFAGALMGGDTQAASDVLVKLLDVDGSVALAATQHFQQEMAASPEFMMKAMGMRTVVEGRDEEGLVRLLRECFGLEDAIAEAGAAAVLKRYV